MDLEMLLSEDDSIYEAIIKENLENRCLVINGGISESLLEDVILHILKWNKEDMNVIPEKRKPIKLFMNSTGGDVLSGYNLIDIITTSETPVYGICFSLCASMAYHIFIACKLRYCFSNSVLLMHDGEVGLQNSASKAKDTMKFFDTIAARTKKHVLKYTKITSEQYDKMYEKEYYMYGNEAGKEFGCVDYVIGEDCQLSDVL